MNKSARIPISTGASAAIALALWLFAWPPSSARAACNCGPDFCQDDSRVAATFATKRASLAASGYPERLLRLFDRAPRCVAAAEQAPDGFSLLRVSPNGDKQSSAWSQDGEDEATADLLTGSLQSYYVMNVRRTLSCCNEPAYAARPDYDADLDLNTHGAIGCRKSGAAVVCN